MKNVLEGLNPQQKQAVTHGDGPLLVIAGAGTGKTTVITRRIAWLITKKKIAPSNILALTFTDKAAGEMETRVDKLVPYGYIDTWISTFHAFGDRILRDHALDIGLSPNFQVLSQPEQAVFLRERIFSLDLEAMMPLSSPHKYIGAIVEHINHLKDEMVMPEQYAEYAQEFLTKAKTDEDKMLGNKYLELAKIYAHYQQWTGEADQIDFGDQILLTIKLLNSHADILKNMRMKFEYCLVDEFQDTNRAQNELLEILFGTKAKRQNITVVGDDDQSIYQFRGAAVQNIIDFQTKWRGTKTVVLNQNYRSSQAILDSAYSLIKNNDPDRLEVRAGVSKKLISTNGEGTAPEFHRFEDDYSEAKAIINAINQFVDQGRKYSDIAILARANAQLDPLIHQLRAAGLPYLARGSKGLYDEPIICLLVSFVKVLADYDDHLSLYYLATSEVYGVDTVATIAISSAIRHANLHFRKVLENLDKYPEVAERAGGDRQKIIRLAEDLRYYIEFARAHNAGEVLYHWLDKNKILKGLIKKAEKEILAQVELENIAAFYEKIKDFVRSSDNPNVVNFVDNLRLLMEAGENPALSQTEVDVNAITLTTVHSAKGLEWPIVFVPSLASDRFPARHRRDALPVPDDLIESHVDKDTQLQEERRLFYVAMTRAKERLILSVASRYDRGVREKKITPFVFESLGYDIKQESSPEKLAMIEKLSLFSTTDKKIIRATKYVKVDTLRLNPHQIDDYLTCPKKYEYVHILKVPITTKWEVTYGNVVHKAIGFYFANKLRGKKLSLDELLAIYNHSWQPDGFTTYEHEQRKKRVGEQALKDFYEREEKAKREVLAVEQPFEFKLDGIKIKGRYDTVLRGADGKLIVDFKTSDISEDKKAKERVKQSKQMQIYALAEKSINGQVPTTALYFVESGILADYVFTDKELAEAEADIKQVIERVKKEDYDATPGYNQCHWCAFKSICPYKYKGA